MSLYTGMSYQFAFFVGDIPMLSYKYSQHLSNKYGRNTGGTTSGATSASVQEIHNPDPRKEFGVTAIGEGTPIPIIYGTVRKACQLLYYGAIVSQAVFSNVYTTSTITSTSGGGGGGGGKGGGGGGGGGSSQPSTTTSYNTTKTEQFEGYDYWVNAWYALGMGKLSLIDVFMNEDNIDPSVGNTVYNDGTQSTYPDFYSALGLHKVDEYVPEEHERWFHADEWTLDYSNIVPHSLIGQLRMVQAGRELYWPLFDDGAGNIVSWWRDKPYLCENDTFYYFVVATIDYINGKLHLQPNPYITGITYEKIGCHYDWKASNPYDSPALQYVNRIPGVAHIAYSSWYLGRNTSSLPNLQFVLQRTLQTGISYENMSNGNNPAAVIYDFLTNTQYGAANSVTKINVSSFNVAATYWYAQGYGISCVFDKQTSVGSAIEQVLSWVGGSLYIDANGLYALYPFKSGDISVASVDENDFIADSFTLVRPGWESTYNDIRFDYICPADGYIAKTLALRDPANMAIQGAVRQRTIDLSAFTELTSVSKRAWEMLKQLSYPALRITFKLNQGLSSVLFPGCQIDVSYANYGFENIKFRITKITISDPDSLELSYEAEQVIEEVVDSSYKAVWQPSSFWVTPNRDPVPASYQRIFEFPWTPVMGDSATYLLLAVRAGMEDGCYIYMSYTASDYVKTGMFHAFAQYGVLSQAYPSTTYNIDDEIGIIYTPYRNDLDPSDLQRDRLFIQRRFVIIGDEIIGFQNHDPYGSGSDFKMTGCIRGMFGTTIGSYASGTAIWIVNIVDNVQRILLTRDFNLKLAPAVRDVSCDLSAITAINVVPTKKALIVVPPPVVEGIRDGSDNITMTWFPVVRGYVGAGYMAEDAANDTWPFNYDGDFQCKIGSGGTPFMVNNTQYTFTQVGSLDFYIRQRYDAYYSDWVYLTVSASAGRYLTDIGEVTY